MLLHEEANKRGALYANKVLERFPELVLKSDGPIPENSLHLILFDIYLAGFYEALSLQKTSVCGN
jgi:hypothetical protein